ncbi:Serine protease inhibitor SERPIN family protein, partial [Prunus dulcis]
RHFKRYAQVRVYKAKLFNSLSQGDHTWHDDVLEVSGRWEGDVGDGPLVPSPIAMQLELGPDMAKDRRALNIPLRFHEWRWLLSEYQEEDGGLPLPRMLKGGRRTVLTLMICLADRKNVLLNLSQRERLLPNLQEVKLLLRTQRMGLHRGRNQGFLLLRRLKWGLLLIICQGQASRGCR